MFFESQMRTALLKASLSAVEKGRSSCRNLVGRVADDAEKGMGMQKVPDWNAKLSMRTYQHLQKIGVMK